MAHRKKEEDSLELRRDGFENERHLILPPALVEASRSHPILKELMPTAMGHFPHAAGHMVQRPRGVGQHIFMLCVEGRGWCRFSGRTWRLGANEAIVVPRSLPHSYGTTKREPWTIFWAHLAGRKVRDYMAVAGITPSAPKIRLYRIGELTYHFEAMLDRLRYGFTRDNLLAVSTGLGHVLGLLNLYKEKGHVKTRTAADGIRQSLDFMRRNLARRPGIRDFARIAGLSVPHFTMLFKKHTGYPPMAFFLRLKIQEACQMLATSDAKVRRIASRLGFEDAYYFSRIFKKIMGASPTEYRRQ